MTAADRSSRYQTSEVQRDKTEESRRSGLDTSERVDAVGTDLETQESQAGTSESRSSQHQQESEFEKGTEEESSHPGSAASDAADASKTGLDSWTLEDDTHSDSSVALSSLIEVLIPAPTMAQPEVVESVSRKGSALSGAEQHEEGSLSPAPASLTFVAATGVLPSQEASRDLPVPDGRPDAATNHEGTSEGMRDIVAKTILQAHEDAGHGVQSGLDDVEQQATDSHGEARSVPSPNGPPPVSQQADLDRTLPGSPARPMPERATTARASDSARPPQEPESNRQASIIVQANAPSSLQTDTYETKPLSDMPHDRHTGADSAFQSGWDWSGQGGREHAGHEFPSPHYMAATPTPAGLADTTAGEVGTAGTAALAMSRPVETSAVSGPVPAPPVSAPHDTRESPVITRSVVFEVEQTDLGRVNVRVAMAHDTVHAYLSTDRPDLGNALMNGQDRLQSALQASGLEMGQFRVHIDRQSAGSGGQEWLAREYGDRSSQQQGHHRQQDQQQDQPTDAARNNRQRLSGLSVFA
jgi:hypothetical protein